MELQSDQDYDKNGKMKEFKLKRSTTNFYFSSHFEARELRASRVARLIDLASHPYQYLSLEDEVRGPVYTQV